MILDIFFTEDTLTKYVKMIHQKRKLASKIYHTTDAPVHQRTRVEIQFSRTFLKSMYIQRESVESGAEENAGSHYFNSICNYISHQWSFCQFNKNVIWPLLVCKMTSHTVIHFSVQRPKYIKYIDKKLKYYD